MPRERKPNAVLEDLNSQLSKTPTHLNREIEIQTKCYRKAGQGTMPKVWGRLLSGGDVETEIGWISRSLLDNERGIGDGGF